jgi:hypothetical protein
VQRPEQYKIRLREHDKKDGRLEYAGVHYHELHGRGMPVGCLAVVLIFVGLMAGVVAIVNLGTNNSDWVLLPAFIAVVGMGSGIWLMRPNPKTAYVKRTTIFCGDGRIIQSDKNKPTPAVVVPPVKVADIHSITDRPTPAIDGGHAVVADGLAKWSIWQIDFHLYDGQTLCHAFELPSAEDARFVSIQLNQALKDIRAENPECWPKNQ